MSGPRANSVALPAAGATARGQSILSLLGNRLVPPVFVPWRIVPSSSRLTGEPRPPDMSKELGGLRRSRPAGTSSSPLGSSTTTRRRDEVSPWTITVALSGTEASAGCHMTRCHRLPADADSGAVSAIHVLAPR